MTFPEIKSLFEQTKANNPAAANLSLEEFARLGARSTGDPEMARIGNASPWENLIRTANQSLNQGIAAVTPDETLGEWSGNLAELVGVDRAVGEQVGRSLPRQIANVGAMAIPVVGPALSFGLSAADTYDQTGSLWQTAIAGAAPMVVGKAMNLGGNATLQAAAKSPAFQKLGVTGGREVIRDLTDDAASFLPVGTKTADLVIDQLPDKLIRFAGAEAAGQATGLALDVAAQGTDAVFNKDYLFANLLGNLAFAPLNITDFVGIKTINTGRTILPPDAGPVRTPSEQRAFEFESLLSSLSPTEKTRAERAAGFDISAQLLGERRLSQINKDFDDGMSQERVLLENDWKMLQEKEPLVASVPLEEALVDTSKLNVLAPEAKERIERFQLKLKELDAVKKSRMDQMKVIGGAGDLLGVALDELKLPESLLQKSAGERSFEDYKIALDGKVSERGQQVIYSMHQMAAGKRDELMAGPHKEVAEEVEKVLQGKGTKFASDRAFVSMALWATGKKPLSDVEVKAKVEKKVKEGNTTKEAVVKVNQKQLARVRGVDKAPRKKQVQVTERVQAMQALINEAAAAKKPDENQKALVDAYTFANSNPNVSGDEATMRALLSAMSKTWQKYEKPAERLQNFKNQVNKIVENTNKAKRRKELPVEEVKVNADELLDEDLTNDQVRDLDDEVVSELVTEVLGEDESGLQAKQKAVEEVSTEDLTDGLIERRMYQIAADYFNIPVELAKQKVADLPAAMTRKLWDMAKSQLEMKQAASVAGNVPQVGMQKLMSLDQWSDTLLRNEGFSPEEAQQLREHFTNAVEMFYSPEVRYGKLGETSGEMKFAKSYPAIFEALIVLKKQGDILSSLLPDGVLKLPFMTKSKFVYDLVVPPSKEELQYLRMMDQGPIIKGSSEERAKNYSAYLEEKLMSLYTGEEGFNRKQAFSEVNTLKEAAIKLKNKYDEYRKTLQETVEQETLPLYRSLVLPLVPSLKFIPSRDQTGFIQRFLSKLPKETISKIDRYYSGSVSDKEFVSAVSAAAHQMLNYSDTYSLEPVSKETLDKFQIPSINVKEVNELVNQLTPLLSNTKNLKWNNPFTSGDLLFARAAAGGGFDFGMAEVKDGKLLRPGKGAVTPRKDGTLSLQEFKVAGGQFGVLQDGEIEFYKQIVPEAFASDRVNVVQLWDGLQKVGEQVKVVTYGQDGDVSPAKIELDRVNGELDILDYEWQENYVVGFEKDSQGRATQAILKAETPANIRALVERRNRANDLYKAPAQELPKATSYYDQISPFDTKEFPVLRVDVVLPSGIGDPKKAQEEITLLRSKTRTPAEDARLRKLETFGRDPNEDKPVLWQQDDLHENLPNTLGWAMVQIVSDPKTGEPVMFVGEVQSRWAQNRRKAEASYPAEPTRVYQKDDGMWQADSGTGEVSSFTLMQRGTGSPTREEAIQKYKDDRIKLFDRLVTVPNHTLLPIHQNLILKAVIKEAQKQGITKVAISDGETAMMTEGHDKNVNFDVYSPSGVMEESYNTRAEADAYVNRNPGLGLTIRGGPLQEGGMRLAYDTTMPSIMKKLVGEGKVEDFGVHKNQVGSQNAETEYTWNGRTFASWDEARAARQQTSLGGEIKERVTTRPFNQGSPVFRNPDGTPKTNATARVYDITAPSERLSSLFARANISQTYAAAATRTRDIFFSPSALKGRNLILQQTSLLTHENSHVLFSKARSGAFGPEAQRLTSDFESWAKGLNPHEAETFVDVLSDVWLGKEWKALPGVGDVLKNIRNEKGDVDVEEVMANVFGAYAAGLNKPSNPTKFYTMLPRVVRDMFDWVAKMTQGVVGAARMYGKFGGDVKQVRQAQKVKEVFDAVRRGARNAERNLADLAELANLRQGDVLDKVEMMYAKGKYGSTGAGKWKEKLSYLFDNAIMRMGSLAATYDGLQDPFMKMKDFSPLNADLTAQVFSSLGMGKYGHTGLSVAKDGGWMRIRNSPELHKLASQINLEMQMLNQSLVTRGADGSLQFNTGAMTPELRGKFGMFKPEAQQAVAEYFVRRAEKANPIVQGVIVSKEWETQTNKLHELLFESSYADFTGQFEKSKLWAEKVMKMAQNGDDAGVMAEVAALSDPVVQKQIGDYITAQSEKIRFLDAEYKKNPNFGSLRRFQPIKVKWIKAGETAKNMQANSAEEAERMDAELRAQGWTPQSVRITDFKSKGSDVFDSTTKVRVKDMEDRVKLALKEMAVPEEFKAELEKEIDFVGMIERTENAQSVFSTKAQRRFAEGVEDLMVLEQDMLWMSKAIYAANRAALDSNVRVALKNPKLDDYLDAKQTFAQGYENFKTQNHEWLSKLSKANAAYFIGFNIPGHIAELMQPVMTHFAEMRYIGVKTQDALGIMLGASKDLVSFYKRNMKKFAKGEEVHLWDDWQNKDEKDMLFRMKHAINANPLNYAYSDVGFEQQKLIEATETGQKQSLLQAVASPATAYANTGLKFYGLFTRHNAIMGLLNGYRSYRKIGLSHEEAVQKVGLFETVVNKSGGKADRQAFPFKNNAVLGHLFYGLQGYTTGWVSQLATYYRHGYKSDSYVGFKNNPEAIKRARSAFKTMLSAQFAAAGVMGMPMVGALTTLLEELTGDDIRGEMYEALDTVTDDPLLSQAASHGLSTALAERLGIPADLHGRFAIGGLLGFNAYDGFSASSLFGPTAGVMNSMWNLGKSLYQERDLQKAFTAGGPTGLRSIAKALDEELPLRNENALSTALGFNSAQARKEREFTRIAQKRNEKAAQEISHAARRVQDALALGSSVAQQKLRTEAMKLAETPEQLEDVIRSIGNKVKLFEEQKTFPKDIREVATPQTTAGLSQLAKAMGVRLPASQEVEREMLKQEVMRRMGMSPASQMRQAMVEDYSAVSDPWQLR